MNQNVLSFAGAAVLRAVVVDETSLFLLDVFGVRGFVVGVFVLVDFASASGALGGGCCRRRRGLVGGLD